MSRRKKADINKIRLPSSLDWCTMATTSDESSRLNMVTWQPQVQLKKLARSISKDNVKLLPLQRVSTTLQDVKRNGETIMLTAQTHIQKLKEASVDDSSISLRLSKSDKVPPKIRKSASEANLVKPRRFRALSIPKSPSPQGTDGFNWLSAFNESINQARESTRPKFQLPSRSSLEVQVRFTIIFLCAKMSSPNFLLFCGPKIIP